jgi:hypothetical protein
LAGHGIHGRRQRRRNRGRGAKSIGVSVLGVTILVSIGGTRLQERRRLLRRVMGV